MDQESRNAAIAKLKKKVDEIAAAMDAQTLTAGDWQKIIGMLMMLAKLALEIAGEVG
jgi:hypothetical protein